MRKSIIILSGNKNEKSDSVCVNGDANMVKEDNMTLFSFCLFLYIRIEDDKS